MPPGSIGTEIAFAVDNMLTLHASMTGPWRTVHDLAASDAGQASQMLVAMPADFLNHSVCVIRTLAATAEPTGTVLRGQLTINGRVYDRTR